jgi:hypothetical protein
VASDRLPWETAGGPQVGREVPITGEPLRDDSRPRRDNDDGAWRQRREAGRAPERSGRRGETEVREVRAADPELSPETNARLTEELREVVGAERVEVPRARPHFSAGEVPQRRSGSHYLSQHRFQLVRATAIVLTFAAVVALATGDWWILPLAAGIHALGTMTVTLTIIRMTTVIEHPSPDVAAALTEEGVPSADEYFSQMVHEYTDATPGGEAEVLSAGHEGRLADAQSDGPGAAAEQSTAMTPTGSPSAVHRGGSTPDLVIWSTWLSLLVLSIVLPAVTSGGWMWLLPAVMIPLLACWAVVQRLYLGRPDLARVPGRGGLVAVALSTAVAVAVFCAVVALAFQH